MRECLGKQVQHCKDAGALSEVAGYIETANREASAARHHARLFADIALSASDAVRTLHLDSAAFGDVMVFLTARLENVIDALADASTIAAIIASKMQEPKR